MKDLKQGKTQNGQEIEREMRYKNERDRDRRDKKEIKKGEKHEKIEEGQWKGSQRENKRKKKCVNRKT